MRFLWDCLCVKWHQKRHLIVVIAVCSCIFMTTHYYFQHLLWSDVALYFDPVVVHKDVSLCGRTSGTFHHVWQQVPNLCRHPHTKSSFSLLHTARHWDWVGILSTVEAPGLLVRGGGKRNASLTETNNDNNQQHWNASENNWIMSVFVLRGSETTRTDIPILTNCLSQSHCKHLPTPEVSLCESLAKFPAN